MTRQLLIDTDTASDDAIALVMALEAPDVEVLAITVVSGNVPVDQGVRNALYTVELCGAEVPVYRGAARPLEREPTYAYFFHGRDGMGDVGFPPPSREAEPGDAVEVLIETVRAHPGLTLVTLGPLTNVALALARAPELASEVQRCVVMGGNPCTVGNVTPAAEFNIYVDPEAARAVLRSGMPIELVGWQLCRGEAVLNPAEMTEVRAFDTPRAHFALDCNRVALDANREQSGEVGISLPDPVAMAIVLEPAVCVEKSRVYVEVETASELCRGLTVVDALGVAGDERNREVWAPQLAREPTVDVCWEIDVAAFKRLLYRSLG